MKLLALIANARFFSKTKFISLVVFIVSNISVTYWFQQTIKINLGDRAYKRQIARFEDCKLKRVGSITWKSRYGYYLDMSQTTCTTVAQQIVICSSSSQSLECYKATNPFANFTYFGESNFFHPRSFISSSESKQLFLIIDYFSINFR